MTPFELGLEQLGSWLGFDATHPGGSGDPDGVWRLGDFVILALEAKNQQSEEGPISLANTRESQGHLNWVRSNLNPASDTEMFGVIVSPRSSISSDALPQCESLYLISLSKVREMAREVVTLLRAVRARATEDSSEDLRRLIRERLVEASLDPKNALRTFRECPLSQLPVI